MRIFHIIPWNTGKNLGVAYNESMELLKDDDWACFLDGDAVHTTSFFGKYIEEVVVANPSYSLFTCYTNRIGCPYQIAPGVNKVNNDQEYHRKMGSALWERNKTKVIDITNDQLMSGVLILLKKETWKKVGGFKEEKMLGIDNDIHKKVKNWKMKAGLMTGIYVQHWYRGGKNDKSHLS